MTLKKNRILIFCSTTLIFFLLFLYCPKNVKLMIHPGSRTLLDAHNCYPDHERWVDRIERALSCGIPLAIEQDLVWYTDSLSRKAWSIVSHGEPYTGNEPTMDEYFFERIKPIVDNAFIKSDKNNWPLIVLNLDFKTNEPEHHIAIWNLLGKYERWLCTARRSENENILMPLDVKPVLVLTGNDIRQKEVFYDSVKIGEKLRLFGAVSTYGNIADLSPEKIVSNGATNYRRWWNNSWTTLEKDKFNHVWTANDKKRLQSLVNHAHELDLWIRFYTLNGHKRSESLGWSNGYNFGSKDRVKKRWRAAIEAGVDFVATDQYEDFVKYLDKMR